MKYLLFAILFVCFVASTALTPNIRTPAPRKIQASAGLTSIMGTVQDGDKLRFVTDERAWSVDNPETLKGHEGHYVRVTAHLNPSKDSVHITDVNLPTASETRNDNRK